MELTNAEMTEQENNIFLRSRLLLGDVGMARLQTARVIVFGVGGVGSWCVESLVRTGLRHITIVDSDNVCPSNINRQLMATTLTIGQPKVEVLKERLLQISPDAEITALQMTYSEETSEAFHLEQYDCVVDAIDSLPCKAHLILTATQQSTLFSSMGAALKTDPTKISVAEFWKVEGDPLARALRNRFKKQKTFPSQKFQCVYSKEPPHKNLFTPETEQGNGSLSQITGIFGFTLAGLVINNLIGPI